MHDYHHLAQRAMGEYRHQPGLIEILVEGDPASGLRYRFDEEASASRFMILRGVLRQHDRRAGDLIIDGRDVLEVWR